MTERADARGASAATLELTFSNSLQVATMPVINDTPRLVTLPVPEGRVTIEATLIGFATSHRPRHKVHRSGTYAAPREKCSACRWFEVRIFRVDPTTSDGNRFAVHTQGLTIIPSEIVKCRLEYARTGYEVVELLTVRQSDAVFLPAASSRALSQAAGLDKDIETAYINRAVS